MTPAEINFFEDRRLSPGERQAFEAAFDRLS